MAIQGLAHDCAQAILINELSAQKRSAMGAIITPAEADVEAFWVHAINAARLNPAEAVMGQSGFLSLRPPFFAYGETAQEADEFCAAVLAGTVKEIHSEIPSAANKSVDEQTDSSEAAMPRVGDLAILCDGKGVPRALIVTEQVETLGHGVIEHINVLYS